MFLYLFTEGVDGRSQMKKKSQANWKALMPMPVLHPWPSLTGPLFVLVDGVSLNGRLLVTVWFRKFLHRKEGQETQEEIQRGTLGMNFRSMNANTSHPRISPMLTIRTGKKV